MSPRLWPVIGGASVAFHTPLVILAVNFSSEMPVSSTSFPTAHDECVCVLCSNF